MARSHRFFRAFARVLPREFRERVFEPAWADILLDEQEAGAGRGGSRGTGTLRVRFVLMLECLRLGLPQLLWYRGRPTRLARRGAVALAVIAAILLLMRVGYAADSVKP